MSAGAQCLRLQLPLKLAWAVTIHEAQGLTLNKVVVDIGKKEFSSGLTFVACSRVRRLTDLLFDPPFPFQRIANLAKSQKRLSEDLRLKQIETTAVFILKLLKISYLYISILSLLIYSRCNCMG